MYEQDISHKNGIFQLCGKLSSVPLEEALGLRKTFLPEPYENHVRTHYEHLVDITDYLDDTRIVRRTHQWPNFPLSNFRGSRTNRKKASSTSMVSGNPEALRHLDYRKTKFSPRRLV